MDNMGKIQKASRRFRRLFLAAVYLVPLAAAVQWTFINDLPVSMAERMLPLVDVRGELTPLVRLGAFLVSMIPAAVLMAAARNLARLFGLYEQGQVFGRENVACFRRLAVLLFWWVGAGLVYEPLMSLVVTAMNPPGQHTITLGFSGLDLTALVTGGILSVLAWVMDLGRAMQEDQELTV